MLSIKRIALTCATALVLLMSAASFAASDITAKELRNDCSELLKHIDEDKDPTNGSLASGFCMGYIDGFEDMHINTAYILSGGSGDYDKVHENFMYCIPEKFTNKQLVQAIVKYVDENPDKSKLPAGSVLLMMLVDTYPCQHDNTKQIANKIKQEMTTEKE